MRVYGDSRSGNCYKLQLLLHHLGRTVEWVEVDVLSGYTRSDEFLALNPTGQVPLLALDDGRTLSQSNAILHYLAAGTPWVPADPWEHAKMLEWQNFEQYSHEPNIAVARFIQTFLKMPAARRAEHAALQDAGHRALAVMQKHLHGTPYFGGQQMTLADISLYAYTHVADEGGFDLGAYPAIQRWLADMSAHPRHLPMQRTAAKPR